MAGRSCLWRGAVVFIHDQRFCPPNTGYLPVKNNVLFEPLLRFADCNLPQAGLFQGKQKTAGRQA